MIFLVVQNGSLLVGPQRDVLLLVILTNMCVG